MIAAAALLEHEALLRTAPDRGSLLRLIVDLTPPLVGAERALFFRGRQGRWRLEAASNVSSLEPEAPAVRELERRANEGEFDLLLPLDRNGRALAAIVLEHDVPLDASERALIDRLRLNWAQALLALGCRAPRPKVPAIARVAFSGVVIAAGFVPVPTSVLAPFEIVARDPTIITAPMDGIVETLAQPANSQVHEGQDIATLDATALRAELELAERRLALAQTKLHASSKQGFGRTANGPDVILARAERRIAEAERDNHSERLRRTTIAAPADGVLLHEGRHHWSGRPVRAGERIATIANPKAVLANIELSLSDAMIVDEGAALRFFPDGSTRSFDGQVERVWYQPKMLADGRLVYPLEGTLSSQRRIGLRGTVRITGPSVGLWYRLLRRPLVVLRQRTGL